MQTGGMEMPTWLDDWFSRYEGSEVLTYVNMQRDEALSAAASNGVSQIRTIEIPSNAALTADLRPKRLILAIIDGRVIRAAFF
jgi:hypothetical protein